MKNRLTGVLVGIALLAPAAHASVGVRVEGAAQTLVPRTQVVATGESATSPGGNDCAGNSAIGALDRATGGDWDGSPGTVERILTEAHAFDPEASANHYWTFWLNYEYQNAGACDTTVQDGDDVLFFVDCFGECASPKPLRIEAPATAKPGETIPVRVTEYSVSFDENYAGTTHAAPSAGATVGVGDRSYVTDATGTARVEAFQRGPVAMRATKPDYVRSSVQSTCVSDGADGFCGTTKPGEPAPPAPPAAAPAGPDRTAPKARILGITSGETLPLARFPRQLRGTVAADPSGLHSVKLRITRRHRGRCWYFSPKADGFRRTRCGRAFYFRIGDRADWTFLLPAALRGRFVVDVIAIDRAFNRDALARGRNRVVFTVR